MTQAGESRRDKIVTYLRHTEGATSLPEVSEATGIPNGNVLHYHLKVMRDRGVITWKINRKRTLRLTETRIPGLVDGRPGWWTPEVRA